MIACKGSVLFARPLRVSRSRSRSVRFALSVSVRTQGLTLFACPLGIGTSPRPRSDGHSPANYDQYIRNVVDVGQGFTFLRYGASNSK